MHKRLSVRLETNAAFWDCHALWMYLNNGLKPAEGQGANIYGLSFSPQTWKEQPPKSKHV